MDKNAKKPTSQVIKAQSQARKDKLARALRDNLRRRKAPSPSRQKDVPQ